MSATFESVTSTPNQYQSVETTEDPTRRQFLQRFGGFAVGVAGSFYLAEAAQLINTTGHLIGRGEDEAWPHNEASFTWLNPEAWQDQSQFTLYLPGFGETNPEENAKTWLKTSHLADMPLAYLNYSHEGTTLQDMLKLITEDPRFKDRVEHDPNFCVNIVGRSLGGLYGFALAAELNIPVKSFTCISSPSRLEYGDFGSLGSLLAGLPKWRAVDTMVKAGVNTYRDYEIHGFDPIHNLEEGWSATMHGENPVGLQQELRAAKDIHILDEALLNHLRSKKIITPETTFIYAASYHPNSDMTVHVQPSGLEYEKAARRLGAQFIWKRIPYDGHANVKATALALRPIILASAAQSHVSLAA